MAALLHKSNRIAYYSTLLPTDILPHTTWDSSHSSVSVCASDPHYQSARLWHILAL